MTLPIAPFASTTETLSNDIKNVITVAWQKMPLFAWTVTYTSVIHCVVVINVHTEKGSNNESVSSVNL